MALTITDLDFDSILNNFKEYLKSQESFSDYNFEGSTITELLRLLSYNTFYNSYYTNHIANEMYLDTASERCSVVSRAKALGYVPSSSTSSTAYVDISAKIVKVIGEPSPTSDSFISLLPYAVFQGNVQEIDYNFITPETNNLYYIEDGGDHWVYEKKNVVIKEGKLLTYSWKAENDYEKFIIPNTGVDINSLIVNVYETQNSPTYVTYTKANSLHEIDGNSEVYWIFETEDERYYLEFGNDSFGKKINIGNYIEVLYILNNGEAANGCKDFDIGNYNYSNTSITETDAITVTNSNYLISGLSNVASSFADDTLVRGFTSNSTAYVYDYANNVLKLYGASNNFIVGEIITEETTLNGNTVFGANGTIVSIKTEISTSTGGSNIESIDNIKFYAPKVYSAQDRLVTRSDYESIIKTEYPFVDSVICWGGDEEVPEQLGEIFVSIKPKSRETLDTWEKNYILNNIVSDRKIIGTNVNILDADYTYVYPSINIFYNANLGVDTTRESIENSVRETLVSHCKTNCDKFDNHFYYSGFVSMIDSASDYIINNEATIQMYKNFIPNLAVPYTPANQAILYYKNQISDSSDTTNVSSTQFTCNVASTNYSGCRFGVDSVYSDILNVSNNTTVIVDNAGIVDYINGIIYVSNVNIVSTTTKDGANNDIISLYCVPEEKDLDGGGKNQLLKLAPIYPLNSTPVRL